jgi:ATP-dependent Clp protease adaptor protein ClpS
MTEEKTKNLNKKKEKNSDKKSIVVYNDNNFFDWVIQSLIDVCDHEPMQAEQCAMIIHYKGKCGVKSGTYEELKPKYVELIRRKLSAKIE